jgi:hypothetical protein
VCTDAQPRSPFQICPLLLGVGTLEASGDPGHNPSSHKVSLGLVSFVCSSHHYLCPLKMFGRRVTFHFESGSPQASSLGAEGRQPRTMLFTVQRIHTACSQDGVAIICSHSHSLGLTLSV